MLATINAKTKKNIPFTWKPDDQSTLDEVYKMIEENIMLTFPDPSKPFLLETDASDLGMGSVLLQNGKIIGIFSKKLTEVQTRYTTMEKELLAIIESLKYFKQIILGSQIIIKTDNLNLKADSPIDNGRVQRWKLILEEFNISLNYQKGVDNIAADYLSRIHSISQKPRKPLCILNIQEIITEQKLHHESLTQKNDWKYNITNQGRIMTDSQDRTIVPASISNKVVKIIHEQLGHPGQTQLYLSTKPFLIIPNIKQTIQTCIQNCKSCQINKIRKTNYGELKGNLHSSRPFQDISTDIFGPIDTKEYKEANWENKAYFLTIIDRCTRWPKIIPIKDIQSTTICKALEKYWLKQISIPKTILNDQGTQYTSREFANLLEKYAIKAIFTTPYNPQGNGISERLNQILAEVLRNNKGKSLWKIARTTETRLENLYHRSLGYAPNEIVHNFSILDPLQRKLPINIETVNQRATTQAEINRNQENKSRNVKHTFNMGDIVFKRKLIRGKTDPLWTGPFTIKKVNNNTVLIKDDHREIWTNLRQIRPL